MTLITNDVDANTPYTQEEVERIFAQFSGVEKMRKGMREFHEACIRLNDEYDSLLERYPNKWVAINHEGTVFVGDTHEALLAEFKAQGVDHGGYVTEYLDPDPEIWLL